MDTPLLVASGRLRGAGSPHDVRAGLQPWIDANLRAGTTPAGDELPHVDSPAAREAARWWMWGGAAVRFLDAADGLDLEVISGGEDGEDSLEYLQEMVADAVQQAFPLAQVTWAPRQAAD